MFVCCASMLADRLVVYGLETKSVGEGSFGTVSSCGASTGSLPYPTVDLLERSKGPTSEIPILCKLEITQGYLPSHKSIRTTHLQHNRKVMMVVSLHRQTQTTAA